MPDDSNDQIGKAEGAGDSRGAQQSTGDSPATPPSPSPSPSPPPTPPTSADSGAALTVGMYEAIKAVAALPNIDADTKLKMIKAIQKGNPTSEKVVFLWAIAILGSIALLAIGAVWAISMAKDATVPDGLIAIASAAAGGLAGLLSPGSKTSS